MIHLRRRVGRKVVQSRTVDKVDKVALVISKNNMVNYLRNSNVHSITLSPQRIGKQSDIFLQEHLRALPINQQSTVKQGKFRERKAEREQFRKDRRR